MNNLCKYAIEGNKLLKILYDEDGMSPREDFDNFGKMICFHSRYNLGDKHDYNNKDDFLFELLTGILGDSEKAERKVEKIQKAKADIYKRWSRNFCIAVDDEILSIIEQKYIILPLFLYDHSGLHMKIGSYNGLLPQGHAEFDSGQVGWIYVSKEDVYKEYGKRVLTKQIKNKAIKLLCAEVETYDDYLSGNVYGFQLCEIDLGAIKKNDLNVEDMDIIDIEDYAEEIDSCWGFFGYDEKENGIADNLGKECQGLIDKLKCA